MLGFCLLVAVVSIISVDSNVNEENRLCPGCPPAILHGSVLNLLFSECQKCHGAVDSTLDLLQTNKQTNNFSVACGWERGFESNEACSH